MLIHAAEEFGNVFLNISIEGKSGGGKEFSRYIDETDTGDIKTGPCRCPSTLQVGI